MDNFVKKMFIRGIYLCEWKIFIDKNGDITFIQKGFRKNRYFTTVAAVALPYRLAM